MSMERLLSGTFIPSVDSWKQKFVGAKSPVFP